MNSETKAWFVLGGLGVVTTALTALVSLGLPPHLVHLSGTGMLLWVWLAGLVASVFAARAGFDRFWPLAFRTVALFGWFVLLMCAPAWGLMFFQPNSNMFTVLFPVTLPLTIWPAIRASQKGVRPFPLGNARTALLTIFLIAAFHLVWFFGSAAVATKIFLVSLALVSLAAAKNVAPRRAEPGPCARVA